MRCRRQQLRHVELRKYCRFTFVKNTIGNSPNIPRGFWEVMDSFVLLACASLAASITLLQWLITCIDFTSDSQDSICWCKWSKAVSLNYGSSTSSWKPWRLTRLDLILMMRDIYISPTRTQSKQRVDILSRNISQMIRKTVPVSTTIVVSYAIKQGTPLWIRAWDSSRKVNHLSKVVWDKKIITEYTRSVSSTRRG